MADARRSPRLTSDEVARVLRRAVEIEAADEAASGGPDGYDAAAVEEAAREVGVSPAAVRLAVAELRAGVLPAPVGATRRGGRSGRAVARPAGSRIVAQQRLVEPDPAAALALIDRFLRTQMFEVRRRSGDRTVYRPRKDLVASLRRGLDFAGAIRLDGLQTVTTVVTPADDRTLVRIEAELAASRAGALASGAAAGSAVTLATGLIGALLAEPGLVIAALPAGAVVGGGSMRVASGRWQRRRDDVAEALAGLLDRLSR